MHKVVLLLSDKRSGSTMLQEELCKHSSIRHVDYTPHTYFETHHWLKAAVMLDRPQALYSGGQRYVGYGSRANARGYMISTLQGNIPDYQVPATDEDLVFEGWEALCQHFATPVFFEKSPQILAEWAALSLMLEWIDRTSMEVRIIGLVRNPLAVQYSANELFSTEPAARQFGWLSIQRNLLALKAMLPEETMRILRYEDVIARPQETLADLCGFIGVSAEDAVGSAVHAGSREKWMSNPSYTLQLDASVKQIAGAFGYSPEELTNPHQPTPERLAAMRPSLGKRLTTWLRKRHHRFIKPGYLRFKSAVAARRP